MHETYGEVKYLAIDIENVKTNFDDMNSVFYTVTISTGVILSDE